MRGENPAIVLLFFRREIGGKNAISASRRSGGGEFLKTHLQNGIVVAEEHKRNLRRLANAADLGRADPAYAVAVLGAQIFVAAAIPELCSAAHCDR